MGSNGSRFRIGGGFEVDFALQSLAGPEGELHLRPKTFSLLRFFMDNSGRLVSKDELIQQVWEGSSVTEDVLVTSVTELRRAFQDNPREPRFIKTVHGTGYRWVAPIEEVIEEIEEAEIEEAIPPASEVSARTPSGWRPMAMPIGAVVLLLLAVSVAVGAWRLQTIKNGAEHESEVAWWRFDETNGDRLIDSSGHGNSGTIHPGVRRVPGRAGNALEFDGVHGWASGKTGPFIPLGNSARTITVWVKTDSTNGDFTNLFQYGLDGAEPRGANFNLAMTPGGLPRGGNGFNHGFVDAKSRIDDGAWHALAATYEGAGSNITRIYVDGAEDGSGALSVQPATLNGGTWIIGKFFGAGTPFRGDLDDVRIFNRALRPAEVQALFRCSTGDEDVRTEDRGAFYFLPVMDGHVEIRGNEIVNSGKDIGGVQLARSDGYCAATTLDGASIGQDAYLSAELRMPTDGNGRRTEAGIYFRSRKAHAGDGIVGGTSAGYWVRVRTGGQVSVMCLNPGRVVAFADVPGLDPNDYHRLELVVAGDRLQAKLDGQLLEFVEGEHKTTSVSIPPSWEGPQRVGHNDGTAGIAFSADLNRGELGGQMARNFVIRPVSGLFWPQ